MAKRKAPRSDAGGAASHPATALLIGYLHKLLRYKKDWRPKRADYEAALRLLRLNDWELCINAALGYANSWNGKGVPSVAAIAAEAKAFAANGVEVRRQREPQRQEHLAEARLDWELSGDMRRAEDVPDAEVYAASCSAKVGGLPADLALILEVPDPMKLPSPWDPYPGEPEPYDTETRSPPATETFVRSLSAVRGGPAAHLAVRQLVNWLDRLLCANFNPPRSAPSDWDRPWARRAPSREFCETALRMLRESMPRGATLEQREAGWTRWIDASIGYVRHLVACPAGFDLAFIAENLESLAPVGAQARSSFEKRREYVLELAEDRAKQALARRGHVGLMPPDFWKAEVTLTARLAGVQPPEEPLIDPPDAATCPDPWDPWIGEKPSEIPVGADLICGMEKIASAVAKAKGLPHLSPRRVGKHLAAAGIELHQDGTGKWIWADDLNRLKRSSGIPDAPSD